MSLPLYQAPGAPSFEKVATCVHCGLCLEACPTYRELRVEMDSPRGRIYLMKGLLEGKLPPEEQVLKHLDQCLDCRACETACPSGVEYADILERTRTVLAPRRKLGAGGRLFRWFGLSALLPSRAIQGLVFGLLRLQQRLGLVRLAGWLAQRRLLPRRLAGAVRQAPPIPPASFRRQHASAWNGTRQALVFPARGERRYLVAMVTGCLADRLLPEMNAATIRVLTENGCTVEVLRGEVCCGALHIHNGARDGAAALARANVEAFRDRGYQAIVSNAAGCSAELRRYGELLEGDAQAAAFAGQIRDASEFLCEIGFRPPAGPGTLTGAVAYDEPCHLLHAQKISDPPRQLLRAIPGLRLVPLDDADACCGSAGAYSLLQPELAGRIGDRKTAAIARSGAQIVATGNPGCLLQIRQGVQAAGLAVKVKHPVELLADAYAQSAQNT